jgi:hypothetical protein
MSRYKIGAWIIAMSWILLIVISVLLIKSCRIKYEVIPQTVQIESFTHNGETHEYVKEFSYYDKKRNIHTITSNLFIDPNAGDCSCGVDYNYMKDGDKSFKETCEQLKKLSTKQKYRIESEHLWYTSNVWMTLLTIFTIILGTVLTFITTFRIDDRLAYHRQYSCCYGCDRNCTKKSHCIWGKVVDDESCEKINKFFGFM